MVGECEVLIVGAGPTGLLLALWLTRLGTRVRIVDRNAGPGETSRAMVVHARTLEFYRQLGFADTVVERGHKVDAVAIREAKRLKGSLSFADFGGTLSPFPFVLVFPQDAHERLLVEQLAALGIAVERSTEFLGYAQDETGVRANLRTAAGTEEVATRYLAGCDGARSSVREAAGIGLPGGTYAQRFYVADVDVTGEAARDSLNICLTGRDFCLVFPLGDGGAARLVGIVPDDVDGEVVTFADVAPSVSRNTGLAVPRVRWFSTYHVHHRVSAKFRDGRTFLLGDAAHLHSPIGGQGMNTGLGDATNLAWKLAAVVAGRGAPALLDSYEPERIAFARSLVATTDSVFTLLTNRGPLGVAWRTVVLGRLLPLVFRLPGVPRLAFRFNAQIGIRYRRSPLSTGGAGRLRAGDRLPWLPSPDGDNFTPLRTLDWQVHVYGEAPSALGDRTAAGALPLRVFRWTEEAAASGLARDTLYLVRPDGYLGLVAPASDVAALDAYLVRWHIRGRATA